MSLVLIVRMLCSCVCDDGSGVCLITQAMRCGPQPHRIDGKNKAALGEGHVIEESSQQASPSFLYFSLCFSPPVSHFPFHLGEMLDG